MTMKRISLAVVLLVTLVSCTDGDGPDVVPSSSDAARPAATLLGRNLDLFPGPAGAVVIAFSPFASSARVIASFDPATAVVDVCPLSGLDDPIPERSGCERDVRTGVRETIASPSMGGVSIVLRSDAAVRLDLVVEYEEGERQIEMVVPFVPAPAGGIDCSDNACNPFFELQPTRAGAFAATVTWEGPEADLVLLQGSVLGRAQSATGVPYGEPARASGSSPLSIGTRLTAPAEYALALRHVRQGSTVPDLRNVRLSVSWPSTAR